MSKLIRKGRRKFAKLERGQVLVVVALAAVGIIAIIGLVMDVGLMFIGNARLRRATDAAALAAALQYRVGVQTTTLEEVAKEFLVLNGVTLDEDHPVTVDTCITLPELCYDAAQKIYIARKLVYVRTSAEVKLAFLAVIGIDKVNITAEATSETASLDLVLVLDTSESMTFSALKLGDPGYDELKPWPLRDPSVCNDDEKSIAAVNADVDIPVDVKASIVADIETDGMPGECHPFEEVKQAAVDFVDRLYYPYDRVAVETFDKIASDPDHPLMHFNLNCPDPSGCTPDEIKANIEDAIKELRVYEGADVCDTGQPCRPYCTQAIIDAGFCDSQPADVVNFLDPDVRADAVYKGVFDCGDGYYFDPSDPQDPSGCTTTNLGDGLREAGNRFGDAPRQGSLWVVVLLTDGAANAGIALDGDPICPSSTWGSTPFCRDSSTATRHCALADTRLRCIDNGNGAPKPTDPDYDPLDPYPYAAGVWNLTEHDADDYARDMADYVGMDQNALIFAIGLGRQVNSPASDPAGKRLLKYAARIGNGIYYYAEHSTDLDPIFKKIGDNIATRLAH